MGFAKAIAAFLVLALAGTVFFGIHSLHPAGAASNPQQSPLAPPVNMLITGPAPDEKATVSSPISPTDPHAVITAKRRTAAHHLADDPAALSAAASHIKIWQPPALEGSDALSLASSDLKLWEPQTPAEVVATLSTVDPSLVNWLTNWQKRFANGTCETEATLSGLYQALLKSRLTPTQCVAMARLLANWEDVPGNDRYGPVTGAFAEQAVFAASDLIKSDRDHHREILDSVAPLIRRLWQGQKNDLRAVEQFYSVLADYEPKRSSEWLRGCTGRIEAMATAGRYDDALAAVNSLENDLPVMTDEQRSAVSYSKGMTLFGAQRYADAIGPLRYTAHFVLNGNHWDAQALLVMSLAKAGNLEEARNESTALRLNSDRSVLASEALILVSYSDLEQTNGAKAHGF